MIFWQILQIQTKKVRHILLGIGLPQNKKTRQKTKKSKNIDLGSFIKNTQ